MPKHKRDTSAEKKEEMSLDMMEVVGENVDTTEEMRLEMMEVTGEKQEYKPQSYQSSLPAKGRCMEGFCATYFFSPVVVAAKTPMPRGAHVRPSPTEGLLPPPNLTL